MAKPKAKAGFAEAQCSAVPLPHEYAYSHETPSRKLWDEDDMRDYAAAVLKDAMSRIGQRCQAITPARWWRNLPTQCNHKAQPYSNYCKKHEPLAMTWKNPPNAEVSHRHD